MGHYLLQNMFEKILSVEDLNFFFFQEQILGRNVPDGLIINANQAVAALFSPVSVVSIGTIVRFAFVAMGSVR